MLEAKISPEELKLFLSDRDKLDDYSYVRDEYREYYLGCQRNGFVSKFIDEMGMYPRGGDKLAGWPRWIQDIEYPNCPICDRIMNQLIFQLDSDDNLPFLWGDAGTGYLVQCREHKDKVAFFWQCG